MLSPHRNSPKAGKKQLSQIPRALPDGWWNWSISDLMCVCFIIHVHCSVNSEVKLWALLWNFHSAFMSVGSHIFSIIWHVRTILSTSNLYHIRRLDVCVHQKGPRFDFESAWGAQSVWSNCLSGVFSGNHPLWLPFYSLPHICTDRLQQSGWDNGWIIPYLKVPIIIRDNQ